jgi:hypothetical protein
MILDRFLSGKIEIAASYIARSILFHVASSPFVRPGSLDQDDVSYLPKKKKKG